MVIVTKKINGIDYLYEQHSYRDENGKVKTDGRYIGPVNNAIRQKPFDKVSNELNYHFVIYIPSTERDKILSKTTLKNRVNDTLEFINQLYGGSTSINAVGSYSSEEVGLIKEPVVKIECFTTKDGWEKNKNELHQYIQSQKNKWKQESIAIEYEEDMYWI